MSPEDDQPPSEIDRGLDLAFGGTQPKPQVQSDDKGPTQVGAYRILDTLGEGGMGTVYLAEQKEPVKRRVALKLIKLGMDSKAIVRRFEQERVTHALMHNEATSPGGVGFLGSRAVATPTHFGRQLGQEWRLAHA